MIYPVQIRNHQHTLLADLVLLQCKFCGERKEGGKEVCTRGKPHPFPAQPSPQTLHVSSSPTELQLYRACLLTSLAPGEESKAGRRQPRAPAGSSSQSTALPSCSPQHLPRCLKWPHTSWAPALQWLHVLPHTIWYLTGEKSFQM